MNDELKGLMRQMVQHELSVFLAGLGPKLSKVGFPIQEHMNFVVDLDVYDLDGTPNAKEIGISIDLKGKAKVNG